MNRPFNVGVVGYRGSGKTTLCYRLMGIDPPQKPNGTTSLDYMTCNWDNKYTILAWDFTPGVSPHTEQHINDMQCIVLCCDGRNNRSSVSALQTWVVTGVRRVVDPAVPLMQRLHGLWGKNGAAQVQLLR